MEEAVEKGMDAAPQNERDGVDEQDKFPREKRKARTIQVRI